MNDNNNISAKKKALNTNEHINTLTDCNPHKIYLSS